MKRLIFIIVAVFMLAGHSDAQSAKNNRKKAPAKQMRKAPVSAPAQRRAQTPAPVSAPAKKDPFQAAFTLYKNKQYAPAASGFFEVSRSSFDAETRNKSKLYLGMSLYRLKLYQTAAITLMEVANQGNPSQKKMAIDYLVATANQLNEPSLLSYSLRNADSGSMSETAKGVFEFRKAEALADEGRIGEAKALYQQSVNSAQTEKMALYGLGLLALREKNPKAAIPYFEQLHEKTQPEGILSMQRGLAIMGLARSYYQARDWEKSALYYRMIPKDHSLYRQSLFELSWALFRNGKFRSAMSPLQTLHSPFYENFYQPESLMLRGVILLFICRNDEIEKILENYTNTYAPATKQVDEFLARNPSPMAGFQILNKAYRGLQRVQKGMTSIPKSELPFFITRSLLDEHNIKRLVDYFDRVMAEGQSVNKTFRGPKNAGIRKFAIEGLNARLQTTREKLGKMTIDLLTDKQKEMKDISGQMDFLKYENLGGRRDQLKKKMSVTHVADEKEEIDRSYMVQNGFRVWPFEGEYWRDEIGNYQYAGENNCE